MSFQGKTVVVTGAASGIGRAAVVRFAAAGALVVAADINEADGQSLVAEVGGSVHFKRCDVSKVAEIEALMTFAAAFQGGIDVLFNNAGAPGPTARIDEIDPESWDNTMNLILRSVAMGIRYAVPFMKGRPGAAIVNTASVAGLRAGLGFPAYSVAKGGVLQLTRVAASDLARHQIRVNAVCPGMINTNLFSAALGLPKDEFEALKPKLVAASANIQPVKRGGQSEDVAAAAFFLASEDAAFITGEHLVVDGGITVGERRGWDPEFPSPLAHLLKKPA